MHSAPLRACVLRIVQPFHANPAISCQIFIFIRLSCYCYMISQPDTTITITRPQQCNTVRLLNAVFKTPCPCCILINAYYEDLVVFIISLYCVQSKMVRRRLASRSWLGLAVAVMQAIVSLASSCARYDSEEDERTDADFDSDEIKADAETMRR